MDKENTTPIEEQNEVPAEKTELEILKEEKDEQGQKIYSAYSGNFRKPKIVVNGIGMYFKK